MSLANHSRQNECAPQESHGCTDDVLSVPLHPPLADRPGHVGQNTRGEGSQLQGGAMVTGTQVGGHRSDPTPPPPPKRNDTNVNCAQLPDSVSSCTDVHCALVRTVVCPSRNLVGILRGDIPVPFNKIGPPSHVVAIQAWPCASACFHQPASTNAVQCGGLLALSFASHPSLQLPCDPRHTSPTAARPFRWPAVFLHPFALACGLVNGRGGWGVGLTLVEEGEVRVVK